MKNPLLIFNKLVLSAFAEDHGLKAVDECENLLLRRISAPPKKAEKIPRALARGASLSFFSFLWFVLIQAEYEMITKPELQNEFPIIKGVYAVYFLGFILLIISVIIIFLLFLIKKTKKQQK